MMPISNRPQGFRNVFREFAESRDIPPEKLDVKTEVGTTAGDVYRLLEKNGETKLRELRASFEEKGPLFMAALGWLLREDKIEVKVGVVGVSVKLK